MKFRTAVIVLAVLGLAGAAVYVRRKRAAHVPVSYTHLTLPTIYSV